MEDQKVSDKRKAPDKNDSIDDLNQSSIIEQPMKRQRIDISIMVEDDQFKPIQETVPEAENAENPSSVIVNSLHDEEVLETSIIEPEGILIGDSEEVVVRMDQDQVTVPLENGSSSSKEDLDLLLDRGLGNEVRNDVDDGDNNNTPIIGNQEATKLIADEKHLLSNVSNGDHKLETVDNLNPWIRSSSPLSDAEKIELPLPEVNISIKAFDPKTNKLVYQEPCIKSDYLRLEAFLQSHKLSLTQSSFNSGYLGDIDSQSSQEHVFVPPSTEQRKGIAHRWTSSTLGSNIPRESIKTVYTISPNDSPNQEDTNRKPRGKRDPKLTSTRLSDKASPGRRKNSDKDEKVLASNGQQSSSNSNGFETPKSKNRPAADKILIKSSPVSTPETGGSSRSRKKGIKTTPSSAKSDKSDKQPRSVTPKSRTVSKEFSQSKRGPSNSPHKLKIDPSPARAVAIVEGGSAKPLTRFEQEVNNEPVDVESLKHSKTLWGSISPNNSVFARWSDKNYYSGIVKEKGLNDTWIIDFDDATSYPASEGHIIPIKILGVGIKGVYCPDSGYHPADANVLGQKFVNDPEIGETVKYAIQLAKGNNKEEETLWCTRRMLSIKDHDARILRQEYQPTSKVFKAAEVSLENIIPETSRRRVTGTPKSASATSTPKSNRKVVGGAFDASTAEDKDIDAKNSSKKKPPKKLIKRRLNDSTASSLSGGTSGSRSRSDTSMSLNSSDNVEKSSSKESPKKVKTKDKEDNQSVFAGYRFFLTASGGGDPTLSSPSSNPVPYDKDEYRDLIESKGGTIIDLVGKEKGKDKMFLISDNYARTVKYIYCLAASIPCISHKWVVECISQNKIVAWKSYELNAGWSLEENKVIPPHKQKPLKAFAVYITAGSDDLYNYWKPVLMAAQAKLLKPNKTKKDREIPSEAHVLVTDATCHPDVLGKAHERMLPVVKPEWLVQSIISGKKADFFNHEKYRVEIFEPEEYDEDEEEEDDDEEDQS